MRTFFSKAKEKARQIKNAAMDMLYTPLAAVFKARIHALAADTRGLSHTTEIMIGIAIVVVVGGLIITAATGVLPQIFNDLMNSVRAMFSTAT